MRLVTGLYLLLVVAGISVTVASLRSAWRIGHATGDLQAGSAAIRKLLPQNQSTERSFETALNDFDLKAENYIGYSVHNAITRVSEGANELVRRATSRGTPSQLELVQVQYANILTQAAECIDPDNLKDAIDNPEYWDNPKKRVAEIESVLDSISEQITENIKQLNGQTDLSFQTALAALQLYGDQPHASRKMGGAQ